MGHLDMVSTVYGTAIPIYGGMGVVSRGWTIGTIFNVAAVMLYIGDVLGAR